MTKRKAPDSITLTYDLLKWAIPTLNRFPRDQRFLLGDRIESHILGILELLISANYSREKFHYLSETNLKIEMIYSVYPRQGLSRRACAAGPER